MKMYLSEIIAIDTISKIRIFVSVGVSYYPVRANNLSNSRLEVSLSANKAARNFLFLTINWRLLICYY
jgi:hypothetical protein